MASRKMIPQDYETMFRAYRHTFASLPEWVVLGGHCSSCEREGWVERWELERKFGRDSLISELRPLLRCMRCGNKGSNTWIAGKQPR